MSMSPFDPQAIYEGLTRAGGRWAEEKEAADLLDSSTKPVLAQLTLNHLDAGDAKTKAHAELMALTSKVYTDHLAAVAAARRSENVAKVRYDAARAKASAMQTVEANARERIKRTGMD